MVPLPLVFILVSAFVRILVVNGRQRLGLNHLPNKITVKLLRMKKGLWKLFQLWASSYYLSNSHLDSPTSYLLVYVTLLRCCLWHNPASLTGYSLQGEKYWTNITLPDGNRSLSQENHKMPFMESFKWVTRIISNEIYKYISNDSHYSYLIWQMDNFRGC